MQASHSDFLLIGPGATKLSLRARQNGSRPGIDKQLGHLAGAQPVGVPLHQSDNIRRLAANGDLAAISAWLATQQHDGIALADFDMGEPMALNGGDLFGWQG